MEKWLKKRIFDIFSYAIRILNYLSYGGLRGAWESARKISKELKKEKEK